MYMTISLMLSVSFMKIMLSAFHVFVCLVCKRFEIYKGV